MFGTQTCTIPLPFQLSNLMGEILPRSFTVRTPTSRAAASCKTCARVAVPSSFEGLYVLRNGFSLLVVKPEMPLLCGALLSGSPLMMCAVS